MILDRLRHRSPAKPAEANAVKMDESSAAAPQLEAMSQSALQG